VLADLAAAAPLLPAADWGRVPGCAPLLLGFRSLGWWCSLARQVVRSSARNHLGVAAYGYGQSLVRLLWPCRAVGFSTSVVSARGSGPGPSQSRPVLRRTRRRPACRRGCRASAKAWSSPPEMPVVALPPLPKAGPRDGPLRVGGARARPGVRILGSDPRVARPGAHHRGAAPHRARPGFVSQPAASCVYPYGEGARAGRNRTSTGGPGRSRRGSGEAARRAPLPPGNGRCRTS
jgi:hypothetical protein